MMEKTYRPGINLSIINRDRKRDIEITETGGNTEDVILTVEIRNGVFFLEQSPHDGGFTATISDGVFYLTPPAEGSKYTAEIKDDVFYLKEA